MLKRLGLIGAGGMADTVLATLAEALPEKFDQLSILVLPEFRDAGTKLADGSGEKVAARREVRTDLAAFLADKPDLVVECAGHSAVHQYCIDVLRAGVDFLAVSTGAFADDALRDGAAAAAKASGAQLTLASGAIGALDAVAAARLSGLDEVVYIGRKPPHAWRGSKAEQLVDLGALKEATTFFEGSARQAAQDYPQNANVAATVALAAGSFDKTKVRLVADPAATRNVHEITVRSGCVDFKIALEGKASAANPKTSLTAGFSVAREILKRLSPITT